MLGRLRAGRFPWEHERRLDSIHARRLYSGEWMVEGFPWGLLGLCPGGWRYLSCRETRVCLMARCWFEGGFALLLFLMTD